MRLPWSRGQRASGELAEGLRDRLTPEQFKVTQRAATERPFSGRYHDSKEPGTYRCIVCDAELFDSATKYDSGTGWPSFFAEISDGCVERVKDRSMGIARIEARCARCAAHLGHVFPDGPKPTGERFCMNSAALRLEPTTDA